MCGRFTLRQPAKAIADTLHLAEIPELKPRYNIAPTQQILAVREVDGKRVGSFLRWGLVLSWSTGLTGAAPLINARADTVATKPSFRAAYKKRRCVVPADGFLEWHRVGKEKTPFYFTMANGGLFSLAGLWEIWEKEGQHVESVCLLTTEANELVSKVHDRMPVIVPSHALDVWLSPEYDAERLGALLRAYPASEMACRQVNSIVNNARNDVPECLEGPGPAQRAMF
jgi:putative SOS response-associated peptidase YedK